MSLDSVAEIELVDDHFCFACGSDNKEGLDVRWTVEGKTTHTEFIPKRKFQGWKGIVHGGIVATLLDEAMTRLAWIACGGALTAEMNVRYLEPAKIGEKLFVIGEITHENRRLVEMRACVYKGKKGGPLIARSTGKAVKIGPNGPS